jgi:hypothetical protein
MARKGATLPPTPSPSRPTRSWGSCHWQHMMLSLT